MDRIADMPKAGENPTSEPVEASSVDEVLFTHQITTKRKQVSKETTRKICNVANTRCTDHVMREKNRHERKDADLRELKKPITGDFPLTPVLVCQIASAFQIYVTRPTWPNLLDAAPYIAESLEIAWWSWGRACQNLGRLGALAVLTAVAGRHERGTVSCPGGLFTCMTERAIEGTLSLDRTLFGLIAQRVEQFQ